MLILSTKLKNAIGKFADEDMVLHFQFKNININGRKVGCYGFVRNLNNDSVVYVCTEKSALDTLNYMYRYADCEKDYKGYSNRWADSLEDLAKGICLCLRKTPQEANDRRI